MDLTHSLQADGGADFLPFLIYLIIFLVWIVSRTLQVLTKGKRPEPEGESPEESGPEMDDSLREFLETVTGRRTAPPAVPQRHRPPPPTPEEEPPPRPRPQRPAPGPQPPRAQPKTPRPPRPARKAPAAKPPPTVPSSATTRAIEETEIGTEEEPATSHRLGTFTSLAGFDALRIPMFSMRLPAMETARPPQNRVRINDPNAARRALIERVVLGPPRALNPHTDDLHQ